MALANKFKVMPDGVTGGLADGLLDGFVWDLMVGGACKGLTRGLGLLGGSYVLERNMIGWNLLWPGCLLWHIRWMIRSLWWKAIRN